jgi:hypothetical protein
MFQPSTGQRQGLLIHFVMSMANKIRDSYFVDPAQASLRMATLRAEKHVGVKQCEFSGVNIFNSLVGFLHKIVSLLHGYEQDKVIRVSSGSSSPLCLRKLKEGSRVRQKHNCLGIVFIAAIVTTCFGRALPSSGHNVDVLHK